MTMNDRHAYTASAVLELVALSLVVACIATWAAILGG